MKSFVKYLGLLLGVLVFFILFSLASALLPSKPIASNIEHSLKDVLHLPDYPQPLINGSKHNLDYAMDGMITNIIFSINPEKPLQSALLCRWHINEEEPYVSQWYNLAYGIAHQDQLPQVVYGRYWHGNSFLFRFLFLLMDYNEIKWIIYILSSLLLLITSIFLYKRVGLLKAVALLSGLFFVNAYLMQFSMQMSPILFITLLGMLKVSKLDLHAEKSLFSLFLILGASTAYFDLLTAPFLTFSMPFLVWFGIAQEGKNFTFKKISTHFLITGSLWLLAYTFIWVSKWLLVALFTDFHIWQDVGHHLLMRSDTVESGRMLAVRINFNNLPLVWINLILVLLAIRAAMRFDIKAVGAAAFLLAIALIPYIWYYFLANHSFIHHWFTYRIQAFTISAVFLAFLLLRKDSLRKPVESS
jgi:hypothetical protein